MRVVLIFRSGSLNASRQLTRPVQDYSKPHILFGCQEWVVEDASKDALGKVQYRQYCKSKAAGMSAVERHELQVR